MRALSTLFPRHSRDVFLVVVAALAISAALIVAGVAYYATPKYTRVGYAPVQPVAFSHEIHAGRIGLDCRYCHSQVGESPHANVPPTQTCMNCHGQQWGNIKSTSASLAPLRQAFAENRPVPWVKIHRVPDYAYFNHAVHVNRGVSCVSCHGKVNEMEVVYHNKPLSMAWCLECHRNPEPHLRPADQVTNLDWTPATDPTFGGMGTREQFIDYLVNEAGIKAPQNCSGCHR